MLNTPPKSAIFGICSPSIPGQKGAYALAMQFQLQESQWLTSKDIRDRQMLQLQQIIKHACETVPFYQQHFKTHLTELKQPLTHTLFSQLPILTRILAQQNEAALVSQNIPESHGKMHTIASSGSTGKPVHLKGTEITQFFWNVFTLRDHVWHQRDLQGKLATIRWQEKDKAMPPKGLQGAGWGKTTDNIFDTGPSALLNIAADTPDQMKWLLQQQPHYLLTYPSHIAALAKYALEHKIALPFLREIRTMGENLSDEVRELSKKAWGISISDVYSCEEMGYLALQCPKHTHYHVQSENVYLEILNDDNEPCKAGEIGRVVISSLNNFATPMIRYELGDYAEVGEHCACGRGLPVIKRILGRTRNRLMLPNGESRFPYLGEREDLRKITTATKQFQFVQTSLHDIEYKMVVNSKLTEQQETQLRAFVQKNLGEHFNVILTYHDEIPCGPRGKYEEFISKVVI